jgi:NAD(P)-binding Rossmann-like domain
MAYVSPHGLATEGTTESTTTVVIGSGLSGLAVASELSRQGVEAIVVDGMQLVSGSARRVDISDPVALIERGEILRLLRHYAQSHHLDIRTATRAVDLSMAGSSPEAVVHRKKWVISTADGVLLADTIVLTQCAQNQLRRLISTLGLKIGHDLLQAMRALGLYLVGVGDLVAPTTREVLRQAKLVSTAISNQRGQLSLAAVT